MSEFESVMMSVPKADAKDRPLRQQRNGGVSRRGMIKGSLGALAGAAALSVVDVFATDKKVAAVAGDQYPNCAGYDNWSGYNNNSQACVGAPYSLWYCGSDGWFKSGWGGGYYWQAVKACGAGSRTKRNAWLWNHDGSTYRCADGTRTTYGSSPQFLICRHRL